MFIFIFEHNLLGSFIKNKPHGPGKVYWKNGDICSGEIKDNICNGKKTTEAGKEYLGKFQWNFEHEVHQFTYGKLIILVFPLVLNERCHYPLT